MGTCTSPFQPAWQPPCNSSRQDGVWEAGHKVQTAICPYPLSSHFKDLCLEDLVAFGKLLSWHDTW